MVNNDNLPKPPVWVPSAKRDAWYEYWRKIYTDAEDTEREVRYNERMMNDSCGGTKVEAD